MKTTALRLLHLCKFSQGWLQLADDRQVIIKSTGSCTLRSCHDGFLLSPCRSSWTLSSHNLLLLTQSWFRAVSGRGRCLIGEFRPLSWRKSQACISGASLFSPKAWLPKLPKPSWAGSGGGGVWQLSLWPRTFCHKKGFFPDMLKNLRAHKGLGGGISLNWQILIQVYLKLVALVALNLAEFILFFFFFSLPLELLWAQAIQGKEFEGYFVSGVGSL